MNLPSHLSARLQLLKTRAALPAWLLAAFAFLGAASDVVSGAVLAWRWAQALPWVGWLVSPVGLLVVAVGWLAWLLIRPPGVLADLERVEAVGALLREAAAAIREDVEVLNANAAIEDFAGAAYGYSEALDFFDDACVASVRAEYEAFKAREERMYRAARVEFYGPTEAAAYFERLADRLTLADVDPGFRVPPSFADWCEGHRPNIRPVAWRRKKSSARSIGQSVIQCRSGLGSS